MLHFAKPARVYPPEPNRVYPPETVAIMTAAFDSICQSLSTRTNGGDRLREKLAVIILRYVDDGERDPERLADLSLRELAGIDDAATDDRASKPRMPRQHRALRAPESV
jgi:hypothetical protein